MLASLADETPEGRSIVALAKARYGLAQPRVPAEANVVPFTAQTRMSGVDCRPRAAQGRGRRGARAMAETDARTRAAAPTFSQAVDRISRSGGTPLAVTENGGCSASST